MTRLLAVVLTATPIALAADPPARPIPATSVTIKPGLTVAAAAAEIERQAGVKLGLGPLAPDAACPISADARPFWDVCQQLADRTGKRLVVSKQGRQIDLADGPPAAASVDGAFRTVARGMNAKIDYDTGATHYDLALDLHWEPRFPVFRVVGPLGLTGTDDRGTAVRAPLDGGKASVTGFLHSASARLDGLARPTTKVATLAGSFTVTAAPKMLTFVFDAAAPGALEQDGVKATLTRFARVDDRWEADVAVAYPAGMPAFESFEAESWTALNRVRLVPPGGGAGFADDTFDQVVGPRGLTATYRFRVTRTGPNPPADRKGWAVTYETPAPLVEFSVRFALKDLKLP